MKKTIFLGVLFLLFSFSFVYSETDHTSPKDVAIAVLNAYKAKNFKELKKYAMGMYKLVITDDFFEQDDTKESMKYLKSWDGKIKDIRYKAINAGKKKILLAFVYYADIPEKNDEIAIVRLANINNKGFYMSFLGLDTLEKADFERMNKGKNGKPVVFTLRKKGMNIETADGTQVKNAKLEKALSLFDKLDKDNFYIILNRTKTDFMQFAYSDKGYVAEYKENGEKYEASKVLSKSEAVNLIKSYYRNDKKWKKNIQWQKQ